MVAITCDTEVHSSIPAAKFFQALALDGSTLLPKIMPEAFKSIEILQGDGGVGTIRIIHFGEGSRFPSAKERIDAMDKENLTYSYSIIEGDLLSGSDVFQSITNDVKIVPKDEGGCICKNRCIYNIKGDVQINEEKMKVEGKVMAMIVFKAIDAHLKALLGNGATAA